jgi:hypothetical protein
VFDLAKSDPSLSGAEMKTRLNSRFGQKMQPTTMYALMRVARLAENVHKSYEDLGGVIEAPPGMKGINKAPRTVKIPAKQPERPPAAARVENMTPDQEQLVVREEVRRMQERLETRGFHNVAIDNVTYDPPRRSLAITKTP